MTPFSLQWFYHYSD